MIKQFQVGGFDDNFSYLIFDEASKEAGIVDPCGDLKELFGAVEGSSLKVISILITHSHPDHTEGIPEVLDKKNVPIYAHSNARNRIYRNFEDIRKVGEGDTFNIGKIEIKVLYTPGHIDDAICFYIERGVNDSEPAIFTGDTLFVEGCGRTTRADAEDLYKSLGRLKKLDPTTKVYTGHNYGSIPISTIGHELKNNRFFLAGNFDEFIIERFPTS